MNKKKAPPQIKLILMSLFVLAGLLYQPAAILPARAESGSPAPLASDDPSAPASPVKLIFIHHSTGQNWLADDNGGLGKALSDGNYFVSDTNYGWGPNTIGDRTDIPNWLEWFRSADTPTYMSALYAESGQNASYTRTMTDPGGENEIIMFKSCFPNSALEGNPADPPSPDGWLTVGHAKYVYNQLLLYFQSRPDKLFVVITAPPLRDGTYAANARAFNQWLVNNWLSENGYTLPNVMVFDFYNVLTSNGGNANTNDLGLATGNHHRWWSGAIQHKTDGGLNTLAYPSGDDHPSAAGGRKATAEFIPLLNITYHRWKNSLASAPKIAGCNMFPADNIWNARVDSLPVAARSSEWVNSIGSGTGFHMDFGSGIWPDPGGGPIGIPYNVVDSSMAGSVTWVSPVFDYADESEAGPYPMPASPLIEYGSDHHVLILDSHTCKLYEIYDASTSGAIWYGGSGAIWELGSNALRTDTWTSADAAGLPMLPGVVRYDEIVSGAINHAIRFTASSTNGYIWPARHLTTNDPLTPQVPPMGARFRLKGTFDISGYPAELQVILQAMKTYGIILADNGSDWYVSGAPDGRWDNDMLHQLDVLTGSDFEAVDTAVLMVDPNSGRAQRSALPGAFTKVSPTNWDSNQPTSPSLRWNASSSAASYEYCYYSSDEGACAGWQDAGAATSVALSGLDSTLSYTWQVRAVNSSGTTNADGGEWWNFNVNALVPVLQAPVDGAAPLFNRPAFDWTDVPGATGYTIQISKNNTFSALVGTYSVIPSKYTPAPDLPANKTLYWRVRTKWSGGYGPWCDAWILHTANPPGLPALTTPADKALTTIYRPRLDWAGVKLPTSTTFGHYEIQVADNIDFTSPAIDDSSLIDINSHQFAPASDLSPNTLYYWRVRAYNDLGQYSAWSAVRSLRTAIVPPVTIEPGSPLSGPMVQLDNRRPTFRWNAATGASGYVLEVSTTTSFASKAINATIKTAASAYIHTADLAANTIYYWRLKATGANGPSLYSNMRWFRTGNPSSVPKLLSPADNALVTIYTPQLKWSPTILLPGMTFSSYNLQVGTDPGFAPGTMVVNIDSGASAGDSQFTTPALPANTRYYWRVNAVSSFEGNTYYSAWSAVRSFRTKLNTPTSILPAGGGTVGVLKPAFTWSAVSGAAGYTIQVSKLATFATFLVKVTVSTPTLTYTPTTNLPAGTTLYWRVRANGANGPSDWTTATFKTP